MDAFATRLLCLGKIARKQKVRTIHYLKKDFRWARDQSAWLKLVVGLKWNWDWRKPGSELRGSIHIFGLVLNTAFATLGLYLDFDLLVLKVKILDLMIETNSNNAHNDLQSYAMKLKSGSQFWEALACLGSKTEARAWFWLVLSQKEILQVKVKCRDVSLRLKLSYLQQLETNEVVICCLKRKIFSA